MAIFVNSAGAPIINNSGAPILCTTCPCDAGVTCCFNALVPTCLQVSVSGVTDGGACAECSQYNTARQITNGGACEWTLTIDWNDCDGAFTGLQMGVFLNIVEASPTECTVTLEIDAAGGTEYAETTYEATLLKTDTLPWTLDFVSHTGTECATFPATATISACEMTCDITISDHADDGLGESRGQWLATCSTCGRKYRTKTSDPAKHYPRCRAKEQPEPKPMRGAGDVIAAVTDALGIPKCGGCAKRQEKLNELFPFK